MKTTKLFSINFHNINLTVIITLVTTVSAYLLYMLIAKMMGEETTDSGTVSALIIPSILAPIAVFYTLSMLKREHEKQQIIEKAATYDYLTNLYNRRFFFESSQNLFDLIKREQKSFSVIYLDIDNFKQINDTYGHFFGDEVLKSLGSILIDVKRSSDVVGRIGGEEFAIFLPYTNEKEAINFCTKLKQNITSKKVSYNNHELNFTASFGISSHLFEFKEDSIELKEMIHRADEALYKAKEEGKNRIICYS